jgi:ABC-type lipoprotein export system ATPase subunit
LVSVGLGDQFSVAEDGTLSRQIRVNQIPIGQRRFVAHLRDLSSGGNLAFADTITAVIDTISVTQAVFRLRRVESKEGLLEVFNKTTLPRDSTVVVVTPVF